MALIIFSAQSLRDLKNITDYIAKDSLFYAKRFIGGIQEHATRLEEYHEIGHLVFPKRFKNIRQLLQKSIELFIISQMKLLL